MSEESLDEHRVEEDQRLSPEGQVVESEDMIILEEVPIVTPNRDVVATGLSFQVGAEIKFSLGTTLAPSHEQIT